MSARILKENPISLSQAARLMPPNRAGKPVNPNCVWRWIVTGIKLHDGRVVRLEGLKLGGRWLVSEEALARFAAALTPGHDDSPADQDGGPDHGRPLERAAKAAGRELDRIGIGEPHRAA